MKNKNNYTLIEYIDALVFFSIYGIVKYLPSPVFDGARFVILKFFLKSIHSIHVKDGATFWFPRGISIGKNVGINEWVFIDGYGGVCIGDNVLIAHGASIVSEDHGINDLEIPIRDQIKVAAKVTIGNDVWIGMGAKILKGVTVGKGAVVGAGAVVTRDIPEYAVVAGIPARIIKFRTHGEISESTFSDGVS